MALDSIREGALLRKPYAFNAFRVVHSSYFKDVKFTDVLDLYVKIYKNKLGVSKIDFIVFIFNEHLHFIRKTRGKNFNWSVDVNDPEDIIYACDLQNKYPSKIFSVYHEADCECMRCTPPDVHLQSDIVSAGTGGTSSNALAGAAVHAAGQVAGAAVAGAVDAIYTQAQQGAGSVVNSAYNLAAQTTNNAINGVRNFVRESYKSPGFSVTDYGKNTKEQWESLRTARTIESGNVAQATNTMGGLSYAEGVDTQQQAQIAWTVTNAGSGLFTPNVDTPEHMLESHQSGTSFDDFPSRPVKIFDFGYSSTSNLASYQDIDIWQAVMANSSLRSKYNNFKQFRANLNIKIIITGSPFNYGAMMVTYLPFCSEKKLLIDSDSLLTASQRKKCFIYPHESSGAYIKVPFFYNEKTFDISRRLLAPLGSIQLIPVVPLRNAQGSTPTSAILSVYGWFSEIDLGVATRMPVLQSLDINSDSNPTYNPRVTGSLDTSIENANSEPSEYNLNHLMAKESLLYIANWSTQTVNDSLMSITGSASHCRRFSPTLDYTVTYPSVHTYCAQFFRYWRGDLIVRLRFIKSQYHRGRVRILWEPTNSSNSGDSTTQKTIFVDIGATDELEITLPYTSSKPWLEIPTPDNVGYSTGASGDISERYFTGNMQVIVDQPLSGPTSTVVPVGILVFVRAAPNFRLGGMRDVNPRFSLNPTWTSTGMPSVGMPITYPGFSPGLIVEEPEVRLQSDDSMDPTSDLGYAEAGEVFPNFCGLDSPQDIKQIIRRMAPYTNKVCDSSGTPRQVINYIAFPGLPQTPGWVDITKISGTIPTAIVPGTATPQPFLRVKMTPLVWFSAMYAGVKGDVKWRALLSNGRLFSSVNAFSRTYDSFYAKNVNAISATTDKELAALGYMLGNGSGTKVRNGLNPMDFESPYISTKLFNLTAPSQVSGTEISGDNQRGIDFVNTISADLNPPLMWAYFYAGASENYSLYEFIQAPPFIDLGSTYPAV